MAKLTLDASEYSRGLADAQREADSFEDPDTPKLDLDNDGFNTGIAESEGLGDEFNSRMTGVFESIKGALTATGIVGAIAGIVTGLKEAINMTAATADGIDKGSKQLGISTKSYQAWDHALRQSGASIQDVRKGIVNMQAAIVASKNSTTFDGVKDQVDGLADSAVGLSDDVADAFRKLDMLGDLKDGKFGSAEELMNATLLKLADFKNQGGSDEDRGLIVRALFGRGGDTLNALLDEGAAGVEDLLKEAENLGLIMSEDEISNAVKYGDTIANLQSELDAIKQAFVAEIIPRLTSAAQWLTSILVSLNPRLQTNSISRSMKKIDEEAQTALASIQANEDGATILVDKLEAMGDASRLTKEEQEEWKATAQALVDKYPELTDKIHLDTLEIDGGTEALRKNIKEWANLARERALNEAIEKKQKALIEANSDLLEKRVEAVNKATEAELKRKDAIDKFNKLLSSNNNTEEFARFKEAFNSIYGSITDQNAADVFDWFGQNWTWLDPDVYNAAIDYEDLQSKSDAATAEVKKLDEELAKAQQDYEQWVASARQVFGLTGDDAEDAKEEIQKLKKELNELPRSVRIGIDIPRAMTHATGSAYIPYDNYPALLHRGERVLTATEARQGTGASADLSGLEDRIIAAIQKGMDGATVRSFLNGREITAEVNRNNINDVKGRRYSG